MNAIVEAARGYLGCPYRHRGRKRSGIDCAGLLVLTYKDLGITLPDLKVYGREPANDGLMDAMRAAFGPEVGSTRMSLVEGDVADLVVVELGAVEETAEVRPARAVER